MPKAATGAVTGTRIARQVSVRNRIPIADALPFLLALLLLPLLPAQASHALDYKTVSAIAYDASSDDIIIGLDGALVFWSESSGITAIHDLTPYHVTTINEIVPAPDGSLWLAANNGVLRYERGVWTRFSTDSGLPDSTVTTVAIAPNGDIWAGTRKGAGRYDGEGWEVYTSAQNQLFSDTVYKIVIDGAGTVWFGSNGAVTAYDGDNWKDYTVVDGLSGRYVFDMLFDKNNDLWIATLYFYTQHGGGLYDEYIQKFDGEEIITLYSATVDNPKNYKFSGYTSDNDIIGFDEFGRILQIHKTDTNQYDTSFLYVGRNIIDEVVDIHDIAWLLCHDQQDNFSIGKFHEGVFTEIDFDQTSVQSSGSPVEYSLSSHPNPFNPATTVSFTLAEACGARLTVFDIAGRKVADLVDAHLPAGRHEALFDGAGLASGVYFARLSAGGRVSTGKMLLIK